MRYVNIKDKAGNELSVRVDQIVAVKHGTRLKYESHGNKSIKYEVDTTSSIAFIGGFSDDNAVELPLTKDEIFAKMGLHLASTGDWV